MRHQKAGKKLSRTESHRTAMFRNMVTSLFTHGRIRTTGAKAKELRRWADRMITLAKRGDLHARRQVLAVMRDKTVVHRLFEEAQMRFGGRAGGYTKVMKIGWRKGDAAPISLVDLVTAQEKQKGKKKKPKALKKATPKAQKEMHEESREKEKPEEVKAAKKAEEEASPETKEKEVDTPELGGDEGGKESDVGPEGTDGTETEGDKEKE